MPKIVHCGLDYSGGGGGGTGDADFIEMTQSDYNELSYEEKHDPNKMYMISDSQEVEGQYFNPVIYSTEEREIGVWTDGKPLYQKTYVVTNVTSQGTRLDTISDIDRLVDFSGTFNRILNGNKTLYELDGRTESANYNNYGCGWNVNNGGEVNVTFYGYSVSEIESLSATIKYTKTTDVPGSGQYTTLGMPAVHYSTDEQIIGTWIDGKTLYRKTLSISGGIACASNTWVDTGISVPVGISKVIHSIASANSACNASIIASCDNPTINIMNLRNASVTIVDFTIEYTKTTS